MNVVAALPDAHESFFQDWMEDYVRDPSVTPSVRHLPMPSARGGKLHHKMNVVAVLPDAHESFFQDWMEDYVRGPAVTPSAGEAMFLFFWV